MRSNEKPQYSPSMLQQKLFNTQKKVLEQESLKRFWEEISGNLQNQLDCEQIKEFSRYYLFHAFYKFGSTFFFAGATRDSQFIFEHFNNLSRVFVNIQICAKSKISTPISLDKIQYLYNLIPDQKTNETKLFKNMISYSILPSLFSFYITKADACYFFDYFQQQVDQKYIINLLKGVFVMPAFTNFLHEVFFPIISPYLQGKPCISENSFRVQILSSILRKSKELNHMCPQLIRRIAQQFQGEKRILIKAFDKALFAKLRKQTERFIRLGMPAFSIDHRLLQGYSDNLQDYSKIKKAKEILDTFALVFREDDQDSTIYQSFIQDFIESLVDDRMPKEIKPHLSRSEYIYLMKDMGSLLSDPKKSLEKFRKVIQSSLQTNSFELEKIPNHKSSPPISHLPNGSSNTYWDLLKELMANSQFCNIDKKQKSWKQQCIINHIGQIISNCFLDNTDPCSQMRAYYFASKFKKEGDDFPLTLDELDVKLNELTKNSGLSTILEIRKDIQEQETILSHSDRSLKYMNLLYKKFVCSIRFFDVFIKKINNPNDQNGLQFWLTTFFPSCASFFHDPKVYYDNTRRIYQECISSKYNELVLPQKNNSQSAISKMQNYQFKLLLPSVFLNHNLRYFDFYPYYPNLTQVDSILSEIIQSHFAEIYEIMKNLCPRLFADDQFLYPQYFENDINNLRNILDANFEPFLKMELISDVFTQAITKFQENFLKGNSLEPIDNCIFPFIDLLLILTHPSNLFSNVVFMLQYQRHPYFSRTLLKYFDHFFYNVIMKLKNWKKLLTPHFPKKPVPDDFFEPRRYLLSKSEIEVKNLSHREAKTFKQFFGKHFPNLMTNSKGGANSMNLVAIGPEIYRIYSLS